MTELEKDKYSGLKQQDLFSEDELNKLQILNVVKDCIKILDDVLKVVDKKC